MRGTSAVAYAIAILGLALALGCRGRAPNNDEVDGAPSDAGPSDAGVVDAGAETTDGGVDAGTDAGVDVACDDACDVDDVCVNGECVTRDNVIIAVCAQRLGCEYVPSLDLCRQHPPRFDRVIACGDADVDGALLALLACEAQLSCEQLPTPGTRAAACEREWQAVDAAVCFEPNDELACMFDAQCTGDDVCLWNTCQLPSCGTDGICEQFEQCFFSGFDDSGRFRRQRAACAAGLACGDLEASSNKTSEAARCRVACDDAGGCPLGTVCRASNGVDVYEQPACTTETIECNGFQCEVPEVFCTYGTCREPCADDLTCPDGLACRLWNGNQGEGESEEDYTGYPLDSDAGVPACY